MYDEDENPTVVTSSKITVSGVEEDPYAPSQVSRITDPEEAGKRRRKSKSRLAKKAARTRRRRHSPAQSVPPRDELEEEEDDELDVNVFERLRGVIPDSDAQELLVEVADLAKGFKAQSESAKTSASRMESLMMQMGREHLAMKQQAEDEKRLMRREHQALKKTLGLVQRSQASNLQTARGSAEGASGSRAGDPEQGADLVQPIGRVETSTPEQGSGQELPHEKTAMECCDG